MTHLLIRLFIKNHENVKNSKVRDDYGRMASVTGITTNTLLSLAKILIGLIANSIAIVLIWMIINVFFGIYLGWGFFETSPGWKNWLYYALALGSLFLIGKFLYKKWKNYL